MSKPAPKTNGTSIDLPANLDLTAAASLAERLLAARGEPLTIDASGVEKLGGQCLQVLLSAVVTFRADMTPLEITRPSEGFEDGLRLLGLSVDSLLDKEITR